LGLKRLSLSLDCCYQEEQDFDELTHCAVKLNRMKGLILLAAVVVIILALIWGQLAVGIFGVTYGWFKNK
jgi:hypothetical protein